MIPKEKILAIVVNFNQELEILTFMNRLLLVWPKCQIVVVDDGSTDHSLQKIADLDLKIIQHDCNLGVGAAIRSGLVYAKQHQFEAVVILSSNGKMDPNQIDSLVQPILQNHADYCTGSRFVSGGQFNDAPLWRRFTIPLFSWAASLLLFRKVTDITCGFRAYKIAYAFKEPVNISQNWLNTYGLEYYLHFWAHENNLRIKEIPISISYSHLPPKRQSKIKLKHYWSILSPLFLLRFKLKR